MERWGAGGKGGGSKGRSVLELPVTRYRRNLISPISCFLRKEYTKNIKTGDHCFQISSLFFST